MYEDTLPHELILSIQRVLDLHPNPDADPLDVITNDFNPVKVLNSYFPDEAALGQLDAIQARLIQNELELRQQIEELQQELRRDQDPNRMQLIQEMISDLLGQISRIREKATESEAVVRNITKEIQVLDLAKKNLILCMTTLKRLQMLVNALCQLEGQVKETDYKEIAQTLDAVKQILTSFRPYNSIQLIGQISRRVQELQLELRTKIDADWDRFYAQDPSKPIKPAVMAAACEVVDILGGEIRSQFVERYVALELKEYRRIFKATDEAGQLDNLSRRFAWFRRLLQTHENETGRVFPGDWKVGWYLTAKFSEITRDDITVLLSKAGSKLTVKQLLDTLQETLDFESSMARKYATPIEDILKATQPASATRPSRSISSAFEPHMGVFIDAQDKALTDMLSQYRGPKSRSSLEAAVPSEAEDSNSSPVLVLPSSTELFYFYAQSLDQCAKLFTGQALYDLCSLHKKWLKIYAEEVLVASMKRPTVLQPRRSMDTRYDVNELKSACTLVNTADYCHTTALELEEKIREKINPEYKEKISFQTERDLFLSVISTAISVLIREFEAACEPAFNDMKRTAWATLSLVSGQSGFVDDLVAAIEQVVDIIKSSVEQKKYQRNFFDKAASLVFSKFTGALVKSRPLKEIGAEQLLIDLSALKAALLRLPGEPLLTSNFTRSVTKSSQRLEALLKVIVTPVILDLKGTPKQDQNDLMDTFLQITSTKPDLESTSFLSTLDMDPGSNGGPNLASPGSSRVSLLPAAGEGLLAALGSPTLTATTSDTPPKPDHVPKFTDFRRTGSWMD
ncbi:Vacuolar protein sorting-associated protein 53 [Steccherinum ochraceum]|uniref:Vacuolar protein sorting-associated protein 53 n=1 Tax=Steccherinum ochraceum TaxID=92696 RepID=A0A4R0RYM7_9APHY|nr:Vacuolar protein sorting-associated protein 53 [Steccherinum ochraceum]